MTMFNPLAPQSYTPPNPNPSVDPGAYFSFWSWLQAFFQSPVPSPMPPDYQALQELQWQQTAQGINDPPAGEPARLAEYQRDLQTLAGPESQIAKLINRLGEASGPSLGLFFGLMFKGRRKIIQKLKALGAEDLVEKYKDLLPPDCFDKKGRVKLGKALLKLRDILTNLVAVEKSRSLSESPPGI